MKTIALQRYYDLRYMTSDGLLASFEQCTIGAYVGRLFMHIWEKCTDASGITCYAELYLLEVVEVLKYQNLTMLI